jgi:hypothetical protein
LNFFGTNIHAVEEGGWLLGLIHLRDDPGAQLVTVEVDQPALGGVFEVPLPESGVFADGGKIVG